jgi:hypothetical protein
MSGVTCTVAQTAESAVSQVAKPSALCEGGRPADLGIGDKAGLGTCVTSSVVEALANLLYCRRCLQKPSDSLLTPTFRTLHSVFMNPATFNRFSRPASIVEYQC